MSRTDRRPVFYHLALLTLIYILHGKNGTQNFLRKYHANRLPINSTRMNKLNPPLIEIIINSTLKDFNNLPGVIKHAVSNSLNSVGAISIAVPSDQVRKCELAISKLKTYPITVKSEDEFLSDSVRASIRRMSDTRYGWILQQFLTVDRVLKSKYSGVLQINSDTYILQPQLWLDINRRQVLMESLEFHQPYYTLLNKLDSQFELKPKTHITHHMLFQPDILKKILNRFGINSVAELVEWVEKNTKFDAQNPSAICIEFELYAQGMNLLFPQLVEEIKFSNFGATPKMPNLEFKNLLNQKAIYYNSMSCHSYLT